LHGDGGTQDDTCNPGDSRQCYDGQQGTQGVGPCVGGNQSCGQDGLWGTCNGEVVPAPEICGDNIDNNCNGKVDEDEDADGDGWTTCGGDCCDSTECGNPAEVNPGAFEIAGDGVDNDCDGMVDNALPLCDSGLTAGSTNALDYAKAIDLCQTSGSGNPAKDATGPKWGVISAKWTMADGTGTATAAGHSIRPHFGTGTVPQVGMSVVELSTANAAASDDTAAPAYQDLENTISSHGSSGFPSDWYTANGSKLPNDSKCPDPEGSTANDPQMLTLQVRVPTNAHSFSFHVNFFSSEFPEYVCSPFNDFFVVLLDSSYSGNGSGAANPTDKNLAFYEEAGGDKVPVGVNLAFDNTGLFTECKNGSTGCANFGDGPTGTINTCKEITDLSGTGLDGADADSCDADSLEGGGTGWLVTSGNVTPGEVMTLRIAIWNTSDHQYNSLAVIDGFTWSADPSNPGTIIMSRPRRAGDAPVLSSNMNY
jgi:hypothetical protein